MDTICEELRTETMVYITCKRCRKNREIFSFWDKNIRRKLCLKCREYNKKYLKALK